MHKGWAILPAGQVLCGKTNVSLHDIATQWESGTIMVMKKPNGRLHYIAGSQGDYAAIGTKTECHHDQTGASFGIWEVVNSIKYDSNKDGTVNYNGITGVDATLKAPLAVFK